MFISKTARLILLREGKHLKATPVSWVVWRDREFGVEEWEAEDASSLVLGRDAQPQWLGKMCYLSHMDI